MSASDIWAFLSDKDRASARFLGMLNRELMRVFIERKKTAGLKQRDIVQKTGMDKATVSRILRGGGNPTARTIAEICWAMGVVPEIRIVDAERPGANDINPSAQQSAESVRLEPRGDWQVRSARAASRSALSY